MSKFPIRPRMRNYRGSKEAILRKYANYHMLAQRIADHVNKEVANNSNDTQMFVFRMIAIEFDCAEKLVWEALSDGGGNGITYWITDEDRRALEPFRE